MAKVTNEALAIIAAKFANGYVPDGVDFAALIDAVQEAAQDHEHSAAGGSGSGTGDAGQVAWSTGISEKPTIPAAVAYACVMDQKSATTNGGTGTLGSWLVRDINTEQADPSGICSIAANVITLPAGSYRCLIACPVECASGTQARLYDNTADAVLLLGQNVGTTGRNIPLIGFVAGYFTLSEESELQVEQQVGSTVADTGLGRALNFSTYEIYTVAEFWKAP